MDSAPITPAPAAAPAPAGVVPKISDIVMEAVAPAPPRVLPPATVYDKVAWLIAAVALLFVFEFHFVSALVPGLLVHALIRLMAQRLSRKRFSQSRAKLLALFIVGLAVVGLCTGVVLGIAALMKSNIPELLKEMEGRVDGARTWTAAHGMGDWIPDEHQLREKVTEWLRSHVEFQHAEQLVRLVVHALVGIVLGALISFEANEPSGPLGKSLWERVLRLAEAFEKIVFAQVKISALNTALTAIYLFVALPLFDVTLNHRATLVAVTFVAGLIPVVGNLMSNTIILVLSLKFSMGAAIASFVYLVVIHKLEYFLNARIVGTQIHAAAFEILLAMLCFEAAFGMSGLVMAPIVYAYVKKELADRRMI